MNSLSRPTPYEVAEDLFKSRFSGADLIFVAGSFRRGEATESSDIDLVVIYPKLERPYRESFYFKGWPVEAFVHDPETLNYFIWEMDVKSGMASLPTMVVEGHAVPAEHPLSFRLKSLADRALCQGPPAYSPEQLQSAVYGICDLLEDLRCPRNPFEAQAIVAKLHESLGNFWFRKQGFWSASGKHIPRRLQKLAPDFAERWSESFRLAYVGETKKLMELAHEIVEETGKPKFDGYRQEADVAFRKPLPQANQILLPSISSGLSAEEEHFNHQKLGALKIRLATIEDVPALRQLLNAAYKQLGEMGLNYNATFQDDELTAEGLIEGRSFVIDRKGQLIGTMKIRQHNAIDSRSCLYIGRFAVLPELQGQGLGLYLLQLAEKIGKREGFSCMQLDTAQPAQHLVKFYQDYGFKIQRSIYFEGKTYTSWIFEKEI